MATPTFTRLYIARRWLITEIQDGGYHVGWLSSVLFKASQGRACNVVQCPLYHVKVGHGRKYVIITVGIESSPPFKRYFHFRLC